MSFNISIKNAGKVRVLEINNTSTGLDLKKLIQGLTQIPIARQKILVKGGKLTDDAVILELNLNLKTPIMVLGTPDKDLPLPVENTQVFLEDLNENQLVKVSEDPSGLVNLGNTCYLNSSLQVIYSIKDVSAQVEESQVGQTPLVSSLKSIFKGMSKKEQNIVPSQFLMQFRKQFAQFAEQEMGVYKQQDAEEAFSQIINFLNSEFSIDDFMTINFKVKTTNPISNEEEITSDVSQKLNCYIDIKTNFLRDGILNSLKDKIEKYSETLQSNTEYQVTKTITRLPKYLTVHFVRFFWRKDTKKKSKILRKVLFPFELDLAEMLDETIKQVKTEARDKLAQIEKDNLDLVRDFKKSKKDNSLTPQEQQEEDNMKILSIKTKFRDDFADSLPENIDLDKTTENPSSVYTLTSVITHQGISADSGHYQAFVKDENDLDGEIWWRYNDEKVSKVNREKIESLAGGGESDSALILVYKAKGL